MTSTKQYAEMQRLHYDNSPLPVETLVGAYDFHQGFPYESHFLYKRGDIRLPLFSDLSKVRALDFACGEGRLIRRMSDFVSTVDGCDISTRMVSAARERCSHSSIYLTDGINCGNAPSSHYDLVYSAISMQHICVYDTRRLILEDIKRVLKPGGKVVLQMLVNLSFPYTQRKVIKSDENELQVGYMKESRHVDYFANNTEATTTNSGCDAVISAMDLESVKADLNTIFINTDLCLYDISIGRVYSGSLPAAHQNNHPNEHYHGTHFVFLYMDKPV